MRLNTIIPVFVIFLSVRNVIDCNIFQMVNNIMIPLGLWEMDEVYDPDHRTFSEAQKLRFKGPTGSVYFWRHVEDLVKGYEEGST